MVTVAPLAMMAFAHGARLIAIVDALPAITTPHPYQAVRSISDAMRELECGVGTQFDPLLMQQCIICLKNAADGFFRNQDVALYR